MENLKDIKARILNIHGFENLNSYIDGLKAEIYKLIECAEELEKENKNLFSKGYICACANLVKMHGEGTEATELYAANFHTIKQLKNIGVEQFDIDTLKNTIKENEWRRKR